MGQTVEVSSHATLDADVRRYSTNRWLTGMGGRLFFESEVAPDGAPKAPAGGLEARILDLDGVDAVYIYGGEVTVTKSADSSWDALDGEIVSLISGSYRHYREAG